MHKKIIITAIICFIIGLILFVLSNILVDDLPKQHIETNQSVSLELTTFDSIDIDITAANIELYYGDKFMIEYKLSDQEKIDQLEIVDKSLNFKTDYDYFFGPDLKDYYLKITVPHRSVLNNIKLKTVSGDITIDLEKINNLTAETTSGNFKFTINANNIDLKLISGDISLNGAVLDYGRIDATSSDIKLNFTNNPSINISGYAKIKYNNQNYRHNLNVIGDESKIDIKNISGKIEILEEKATSN